MFKLPEVLLESGRRWCLDEKPSRKGVEGRTPMYENMMQLNVLIFLTRSQGSDESRCGALSPRN